MKRVTINVEIDCPDDIPQRVIDWMGVNLAEHAAHEFERDYDAEWTGFEGPPVVGRVTCVVMVRPRTTAYAKAVFAERAAYARGVVGAELGWLGHAADIAAEVESELATS